MNELRNEESPIYDIGHDNEEEILAKALAILEKRTLRGEPITSPNMTKDYLRMKMAGLEHEVFGMVVLDNRNHVLGLSELFRGTIDGASVYPREVVKEVLRMNGAAVILYHNHPSGNPEPSAADERITERLKAALGLIDVRILDHLILAGSNITSFAEAGLI